MKRFLAVFGKVFSYFSIVLLILLVIAFYALQLPEVQTQISNKATDWLAGKLGGNISISKVKVRWFDSVVFEDVAIKDNKDRHMIYVRELYVNTKTSLLFNIKNVVKYDPKVGLKSLELSFKDVIKFDNNLDFVTLTNADVNFVKDSTGLLNFDYWLKEIDNLSRKDKKKKRTVKPFTIDNVYLKNTKFRIVTDNTKRRTDGTFDFANFEFENLNAQLEDLYFKRDTIILKSKGLEGSDNYSKLVIKDIKGNFCHSRKGIKLDNLSAKLNDSYIGDKIYFSYNKPSDFGNFFNKINIDANLKNAVLQAKDIGLFIPYMGKFTETYKVNSQVKGKVVDLRLENMLVDFGKGSKLAGKAHFKGLPNLPKTISTWHLDPSVLLAEDVKQYSANTYYQKYIQKIERLDFSGFFDGLYNNFHASPNLASPKLGKIKGEVVVLANAKLEYTGDLQLENLKIGEILENPQLDEISFKGNIKGSGKKLDEAAINLDGLVSHIDFRKYRYSDIEVDGDLGQSLFEGKLKITDPNLLASLDGRVDFNQKINKFNFEGDVKHANLKVLGFTNKEFLLKTKLDFNFEGNKLDDWLGEAHFFDFEMEESGKILAANRLQFSSVLDDEHRDFLVNSEFFDVEIHGDFVPSVLIKDVREFVQEHVMYFKENEAERNAYYLKKRQNTIGSANHCSTRFNVDFNNPAAFFAFFAPQVNVAKNTRISGNFDVGEKNALDIQANTDTLSWKGNEFYATNLEYQAEKNPLSSSIINKVRIKSDKQKTGNNTISEELVLNGQWEGNNTIDFRAFVTQETTSSLLDLRGKIDFYREGFKLKLLPNQTHIKVIGLDWAFNENNSIDFKKKQISFTDFEVSSEKNEKIALQGMLSANPKDVLELSVDKFNIENLLPFINVSLKGTTNGNLRIRNFYKEPFWTSNLHVEDFYYKKSLIGTVTTSAVWDEENQQMKLRADIFRNMEDILNLEGTFKPAEKTNPLNLTGSIHNVDLSILLGMTGNVFSQLNGFAEGDFKVHGTLKKPRFNGEIDLKKGSLTVAVSGTKLFFEDKVILTDRGFELPTEGVTLKDAENGNAAKLTGGVFFKNSPGFDINLRAMIEPQNPFRIMDIKPYSNDTMFGIAFAHGDINLSGDFDNLLVSGNLVSSKGTKVVIPTDGSTEVNTKTEGISFLKPKELSDTIQTQAKTKRNAKTEGVRLAFNLSLTPDAEGEVVFDRTNNDVLNLYGNGKLSVIYDSRGEFSINGPYNVQGGKYYFSFQNLASLRRFDISDNSKIIFNGDPLDANLDIKATYAANISLNKVSSQMSNSSARFPVFVNVSLTDKLLTPTIKYNISFDQNQVPLRARIDILSFEQRLSNDEQLLSRNVSSILVFNDVFPENSITSDAISQQFLIDNVSSLLSNQIGNLASKLNPNLEFGLRFGDLRENLLNNMQLDFSYRFLNNRFRLSGKGAFVNSLEDNLNLNSTNYGQLSVGGELEYMISDDGAYRFKLYSRSVPTNYYVFYSQGNVVVSGGSLIISRNFNSFFRKKEKLNLNVGVSSESEAQPLSKANI